MALTPALVSIPPNQGPSTKRTVGTPERALLRAAATPLVPPPTTSTLSLGPWVQAITPISRNHNIGLKVRFNCIG